MTGLHYGRCKARETEPVKPVPLALMEPTIAAVSPTVCELAAKFHEVEPDNGEIASAALHDHCL